MFPSLDRMSPVPARMFAVPACMSPSPARVFALPAREIQVADRECALSAREFAVPDRGDCSKIGTSLCQAAADREETESLIMVR